MPSPKQAKQEGIDWEELDRLLIGDAPTSEWFRLAEYQDKCGIKYAQARGRLDKAVREGSIEKKIFQGKDTYYRIKK